MKSSLLLILLFPLASFSAQYSKSICLQAGLKDIDSLQGFYKRNLVVPTAEEYKFNKDMAAEITRTDTGTYSFSNLKNNFIARTCEINGQLLMEVEGSYRLEASPDDYVKSYFLYVVKNKEKTLKLQELIFNPKKLDANKISYKIVDQVNCQGAKELFAPKYCQLGLSQKLLVIENSNVDFKKLFGLTDFNSIVLNFYK